jgi:hypothetical protein
MDEQNLNEKSWKSFPLSSYAPFYFSNALFSNLKIWQLTNNVVHFFLTFWVSGFE